jgi:5-methylcytosine-specific restriction endonuclease McrA
MLADGLVHLTAVDRLGPSLTEENHLSILEEATHKTVAQVEEIVARLRPKPPVPSSIRKLGGNSGWSEEGESFFDSDPAGGFDDEAQDERPPSRTRRSAISPLAPGSHDIHITADDETVYALRELQELLSHQVPNGDPAVIIKHSLLRTLKEVKKEKFGTGKRRKKAETSALEGIEERAGEENVSQERPNETPAKALGEENQSRYIPKDIRKAVWERDGGRCAFVSTRGKWCTERRFLEFHHIIPFAWRGETTVDNLELRCRTHNAYEGDLIFGKVIGRSDPRWHQVMSRAGSKTSAPSGGSVTDVPKSGYRETWF